MSRHSSLDKKGGIEFVVDDYINELSEKKQHIVHLATSKKPSEKNYKNVSIRLFNGIAFFNNILSFKYLYESFLNARDSVVNIHFPFIPGAIIGTFLSKETNIIVTWHCDVIMKGIPKLVYFFLLPFVHSTLTKATKIIVTSESMISSAPILKKYKSKCHICHIPIKELQGSEQEKVIDDLPENYTLFIGRLVEYKGLKVIIEAYKHWHEELPPLVLAGDGPLAQEINELQLLHPKKIFFINKVITEEEKNFLIRSSSFLLFPSITKAEAFGVIQLEAMRYGKPVINTELGTGTSYVSLDGITGLTIEPNSVLQLKDAIIDLSSNYDKLERFSKNAKLRVNKEFSYKKFKKNLQRIFDV